MRINLMDPALRWAVGHHLDLDIGVARELRNAGHDVHVYSHRDIAPDARERMAAHARVSPLFQNSPYDDPLSADPVAGELIAFMDAARRVADDLRSTRAADFWIWPSLFASQHYANVLANPRVPIAGCVHVEPAYLNSLGALLWRFSFVEARKHGAQIRTGAFEAMLCGQYMPLAGDGNFRQLPIPYDTINRPEPKENLSTVGFFGNQRNEKGVTLIQNLIPMLLDEGFRIVLHDSSGGSAGSGNDQLRIVLGFVEDLAAEIITCDLVVTPYDPGPYKTKGSAIVWSALANGVPVVAPGGTASGDLIIASGAGTVFDVYSAESVFQAILDARRDYAKISAGARQAGRSWMEAHGLGKYVAAMLA